ncbi:MULTISPECIES: hypothetical protein [unclassified Nitratiruptor]|uniref:hypothetical protein n=1 Tax=unclassified Nitratiruptor TaxID=2624044 RepID=UPI001915A5D1|nr:MULTISPECIES: hypothetical protein [unclassified Nitratiruptor]BCD60871.1 hypothetical protein NitYY0810_C1649 [Nitratiruptor sp. YY08-10]BCD64803.1 MSHA biogenesis protein MshJ [Nitratiruptor sp. YY08-14]
MREIFDRLEERFESLDSKTLMMIYALVFLLALFLFYFFSYEPLEQQLQSKSQKLQHLIQKARKLSKTSIVQKIKREQNEIAQLNLDIEQLKTQRFQLMQQLQQKHYQLMMPKNFYAFLTDFLSKSVIYGVDLQKIDFNPTVKKFVAKLYIVQEMELTGSGRFLDIVKLLRYAESNRLLFRISSLHIELSDEYPTFHATLQFFGDRL